MFFMPSDNNKHSNDFSIIKQDNKIIIDEVLKNRYSHIYDSIIKEEFELNVENCDVLNEIHFNDKVVGFATYTFANQSHLILTNIYILPSHRGNKLFNKEITNLFEKGYVLSINYPSKKIVELLIKYGYAEKVNDSLVVSAINFRVNKLDMISNGTVSNHDYENSFTSLYDLNICAVLLFNITNSESFEVYYSKISAYDKKEISSDVRKNIDGDYFKEIVNILTRRDLEIERRLLLLRNNLPSENLEIKELFSSDLSDIFMDYVEKGMVTLDEIKKIKQQLFIDLTRSSIKKQSIPTRLHYLVLNYHNTREIDENVKNPCPYCNEELDFSQRYCISCGYDIFNDMKTKDKNRFIYQDVLKEKLSFKHSINNIVERKNEFDEEYLITLAICYVIDNLNIRNYYEIFDLAANKYNLTNHNIRKIMDERKFITYNIQESDWFEEGQQFSVSELKELLLKNNLKQSGNKNELIERIQLNVSLDKVKSKVPKITQSGYNFKEDSLPLLYHKQYLENYIYDEFENEFNNSEKTSMDEITIDFLEKHVQSAMESKNHNQLVDSLKLQSMLYSNIRDIEEVLRIELKIFLVNINMLFVDDVYYDYYNAIEERTFKNLKKLMYEYDFDELLFLLGLSYQEFDEKDLIISMDELESILHKIYAQNTTHNLNYRIKYEHYPSKIGNDTFTKSKKQTTIRSLDDYF